MGTDSKATSKTDIADTLGETFRHNSSSFNYFESFRKIKTEQEKVKLNFKSQNNGIYNKDFNLDELVEAIQLSQDSATGPDEIKCLNIFVCFVALRPKSTAMVIAGRSVHLTTLFPGQAWTSG